ncbi:uncharacterized protein B0I36DRAFT_352863 [Microdochium trichocladiopsis]|uniref:Uncharacterized protein n=1 Tax=Microdochium trichocladiopsis TaxID=1682393 RepID=A0A9P8Y0M2_9PEZI|nr:uncharacterized protein B0I36DRAFT_352863 [Microdochium trichocladiopsis]KAH7024652.1 hypothetical protein B0I36DRAFT_352863 [Microdochium trichocladiopsis]
MISRHFLGVTLGAVGVTLLSATVVGSPLSARQDTPPVLDWASLEILTAAADAQVQSVIDGKENIFAGEPRGVAHAVRQVIAPFVWPNSTYYHDASVLPLVDEMLAALVRLQHDDGTYTVGNRHSPPDTGFLIDDYSMLVRLLENDDFPSSQARADKIRGMLEKAGPASLGGAHTPNHRWKLCGALAHISAITGNETLVRRVDQWLAEGIDIDADGIYSERSPIYYSAVTNPSLISVARELNRPELYDYVRRNLELIIEHTEPISGEIETVQSRRQDQRQSPGSNLADSYPLFRELALRDNSGRFAAMVRLTEKLIPAKLGDYLGTLVERPELAALLPEPENPFGNRFSKHYATANLVRARKGNLTTTVFGGTDWYTAQHQQSPFFNRFGSGLSTNPTFFRAWNGDAVLEAVRMLPNFFTMGHFRSNGLNYSSTDGVTTLGNVYEVPYFLPMEPEHINANATYALSRSTPDGRFYAMLDFENRPKTLRRLQTEVKVVPTDAGYDLEFEVSGEQDVEVMFELTFRPNGTFSSSAEGGLKKLEDTTEADGAETYHLIEGTGRYTSASGQNTISFGPGLGDGRLLSGAGEQYSWMNGKLELVGHQVYITGITPLKYTLQLGFE